MSTQIPPPAQSQEILSYLEREIRKHLSGALAAMLADQPLKVEKAAAGNMPADCLWFDQPFHPSDMGSLAFAMSKQSALGLGHQLLSANGLEGEDDETALGTLSELLSQVSSGLATSLSAKLKIEVTAKPLVSTSSSFAPCNQIAFTLIDPKAEPLLFLACPKDSLLAALCPKEAPAQTSAVIPVNSEPPPNARNLELLLDVEMPVSVSFGRTQLPLKDVIKLTTGSIVELNKSVSEPVDIIVNNCVIARGEVVVVEGNFGVRIKQIMSKQDRLRSFG